MDSTDPPRTSGGISSTDSRLSKYESCRSEGGTIGFSTRRSEMNGTKEGMTRVDINCDMSEGFGAWMFGDDIDAAMMPMVSSINVAAGFHAGDPNTMARTVGRAKEHGVGVGVHPGFRDLVGFGRRHI